MTSLGCRRESRLDLHVMDPSRPPPPCIAQTVMTPPPRPPSDRRNRGGPVAPRPRARKSVMQTAIRLGVVQIHAACQPPARPTMGSRKTDSISLSFSLGKGHPRHLPSGSARPAQRAPFAMVSNDARQPPRRMRQASGAMGSAPRCARSSQRPPRAPGPVAGQGGAQGAQPVLASGRGTGLSGRQRPAAPFRPAAPGGVGRTPSRIPSTMAGRPARITSRPVGERQPRQPLAHGRPAKDTSRGAQAPQPRPSRP